LIEDGQYRLSLVEKTKRKIANLHTENYWQRSLQEIYIRAANLSKKSITLDSKDDQMYIGEPDVFLPHIYGWDVNVDWHICLMPINQRLRHYFKLAKKYNWRKRIILLLPLWLIRYYTYLKMKLKGDLYTKLRYWSFHVVRNSSQ
jgi:hypothetical protein